MGFLDKLFGRKKDDSAGGRHRAPAGDAAGAGPLPGRRHAAGDLSARAGEHEDHEHWSDNRRPAPAPVDTPALSDGPATFCGPC